MKIKLRTLLTTILIAFISLNAIFFLNCALSDNNLNRPYPAAKMLLSCARGMNELYIFPIARVLGIQTPVLAPFKGIRDVLYNAGVQQIPPQDGERDIWWAAIYFYEYKIFYNPQLYGILYSQRHYGAFEHRGWLDNIYQQLLSLSTHQKMADPAMRKNSLGVYATMASIYLPNEEDVFSFMSMGAKEWNRNHKEYAYYINANKYALVENINEKHLKFLHMGIGGTGEFLRDIDEQRKYFFTDSQEIQKVRNVLDGYWKLKQFIQQQDPESYIASQKEVYSKMEPMMLFQASQLLLASKILTNNLSCSDVLFLKSRDQFPHRIKLYGSGREVIVQGPTGARLTDLNVAFSDIENTDQFQFVEKYLSEKCKL